MQFTTFLQISHNLQRCDLPCYCKKISTFEFLNSFGPKQHLKLMLTALCFSGNPSHVTHKFPRVQTKEACIWTGTVPHTYKYVFRLFLCVEVHSIQQVSVWREETLFIQNQINFEHFPSHKTSANFRRRKKQPWTIQQYSWLPTWAISLIQCSEGMHHFSSLFESCWVVP